MAVSEADVANALYNILGTPAGQYEGLKRRLRELTSSGSSGLTEEQVKQIVRDLVAE